MAHKQDYRAMADRVISAIDQYFLHAFDEQSGREFVETRLKWARTRIDNPSAFDARLVSGLATLCVESSVARNQLARSILDADSRARTLAQFGSNAFRHPVTRHRSPLLSNLKPDSANQMPYVSDGRLASD